MPGNDFFNKEPSDLIINLNDRELRGAIAMAFGHLIGVTCNSAKQRICKTDTINKYGRMAYEAFKNAKTHHEMMVTLQALRNSKQVSLIEKLVPLVKSGAVSHALRPHVIYALTSLGQTNRNKYLAAIQPIILNTTESTEVRIAAIASLFQSVPTFLELQQLVAASMWERNLEVLNFMLTSFRVIEFLTSEDFNWENFFKLESIGRRRTLPTPRTRASSP